MTTVLLKSAELHLPPAPTPLPGIVLVAGERRLAHTINNMLTALWGNLEELAITMPYSEQTTQLCNDMRNAMRRMRDATNTAMSSHRPAHLLLNETAEESVGLFGCPCMQNGISVATKLKERVPIYASQASLDDIIANLIANAIQAMMQSARKLLTVRVDTVEHFSRLSVTDTGCGMDDETIGRLFYEQFTTKKDGHGIGLLTVFAGVAQLNGDIRVTSEPDNGTTIELLFPWTPPAKESA